MRLDSLDTLLTEELRDVYDAEKQITRALPKLTKAAHSRELKDALKEHLEVTKGHINRLEEVFSMLDEKPRSRPCTGMKGLLKEGGEIAKTGKRGSDDNVADAAIISAAQRVEHYEIAAYGTLRTYAEQLGNDRIAKLLEQTKQEEADADRKLSSISEDLLATAQKGLAHDANGRKRTAHRSTSSPRRARGR
jgi:ferritin-like metal-binding protein YciE